MTIHENVTETQQQTMYRANKFQELGIKSFLVMRSYFYLDSFVNSQYTQIHLGLRTSRNVLRVPKTCIQNVLLFDVHCILGK